MERCYKINNLDCGDAAILLFPPYSRGTSGALTARAGEVLDQNPSTVKITKPKITMAQTYLCGCQITDNNVYRPIHPAGKATYASRIFTDASFLSLSASTTTNEGLAQRRDLF